MLPPQNLPLEGPSPVPMQPPRVGMRQPEVLLPQSPPRLAPPSSSNYVAPPSRVMLGEPDFSAPKPGVEERKPIPPQTPPPPASFDDNTASPLPIGISSFAQVKEGVSTGLRPDLDGLDWLNSKGYKSVVFLRSAKDDDSSDKRQVEKRGLKYQSIVIAPESINQNTAADFNRLVNDLPTRSVFIYDVDGKRAGVMWYLYFRTSEMLSDEEARSRATRYGLKEKGDPEQIQLWTAVQKYMAGAKS